MIQHPASWSHNQKPRCSSSTYPKPSFWLWQMKWSVAQNRVCMAKFEECWLTSYGLGTTMTSSWFAAKQTKRTPRQCWNPWVPQLCALSSVLLLFSQWARDWESAGLSTLSVFDFSTRVATQISSHQVTRIHCIRSNHCFFCCSFPEVQFPAAFPKHLWSFGVLLSAMLLGYSPKSWQAT